MQSVEPRSQDDTLRSLINSRIQAVLDHGQYIMGPEVAELEQRLAGLIDPQRRRHQGKCPHALRVPGRRGKADDGKARTPH